jgi:quinolinate synthase
MLRIQIPLPERYTDAPLDELADRVQVAKDSLGERIFVLGHHYQRDEVIAFADARGDSYALSVLAQERPQADYIVFCGVHFMAETAKILSPRKTVLMPDPRAGCPMADFVTGEALRRLKEKHPGAVTVAYVNSTAEVKAESDICCTSSNAVQVVESIPEERTIIFVPDRNLAHYVAEKTGRENIVAWDGYCYVHDDLVLDELDKARKAHPEARVVIHPEAREDLLVEADEVTSTGGMVRLAEKYDALILGTERGLVDQLRVRYPEKTFIPLSGAAVCGNMKLNTLSKLAWSLDHREHEVTLDEGVRTRAEEALRRMLELSGGWTAPSAEEEELELAGVRPKGCGCA